MPSDLTPDRGYSFTDFSNTQPDKPLPGNRLDTELDRVLNALKAHTDYFTRTIGPDGSIIGQIITQQNIQPSVLNFWVDTVEARLASQIESAQTAEQNTQNWLTQAQNASQQAQDAQSQTEQLLTQSGNQLAQVEIIGNQTNGDRARAETAQAQSQISANDAQTSASSARISEDMAYRWAEKLDGPVFTPTNGQNNGDPDDDGFYSSRYWANFSFYNNQNGSFWYLGPRPTAPLTGNGGVPLQEGMWYYDTTENKTFVWTGIRWQPIGITEQANYTATDDAGDGSVSGDIQATDFSSQTAEGTSYVVLDSDIQAVFYHKSAAYVYVGSVPNEVGVGATGTPVQDGDFAPIGVGAFISLNDTPQAYTTNALRVTRVNAGENAIEFWDINEALDPIRDKNTEQDTRLDGHDADVTRIDAKDAAQDTRLDGHDADVIRIDAKDAAQDTRLDGHDTRLDGHDSDITRIDLKDAEQDTRLDGHDADVTRIDLKDAEQDGRLDGHDTDIAARVKIAGDTMTGPLSVGDGTTAAQFGVNGTGVAREDIYEQSGNVGWRRVLTSNGILSFNTQDAAGVFISGRYDFELDDSLLSGRSIIRRASGDERYDTAKVYSTDFDDLVLDATWQALTPSSPTVVDPGTYLTTIQGLVTGTGGNASYQFRLTVDGTPVQTGTVKSISNGEVRALSLTFHAATGGGTVAIEATGNNCTVSNSDTVLTRVGRP